MNIKDILSKCDHTLLSQTATLDEIKETCSDAIKYGTASVCIPAYYVKEAKEFVGDKTAVCTVIGFPNGYSTTAAKCFEARDAVENGADEIDMVINIGALKDKEYSYVKEEIEEIRDSISGKTLKVIIETCYLTDDEIIKMTEICNETFVNFIKTSTGFGTRGCNINDLDLINSHKSETLEIKASGGIKDYDTAVEFISHGASRLGTSSGVNIMGGEDL